MRDLFFMAYGYAAGLLVMWIVMRQPKSDGRLPRMENPPPPPPPLLKEKERGYSTNPNAKRGGI